MLIIERASLICSSVYINTVIVNVSVYTNIMLLYWRTDKFPGKNDIILPSFVFGSIAISSKMWFYKLKTPGQWLDDDVSIFLKNLCFYSYVYII